MDEQKRPRAWVYARIPGDYDGTMNSYKVCSMQALHDGCDIVGGSIDERGGWLLRPGYRDMMQQIKGGKVDRVYICRMRQISGKERHLYSFFKRLMQRGIQVTATEYSLRDRVNMFRLARRVETVCLLSKLNAKQHIEVDIHMDELDLTDAEKKATYSEIKEYVLEHTGLKVSSLYIAQVKQKCGIIERENYNKPKSDDAKQPQCPPDKEKAIKEALKHFGMI